MDVALSIYAGQGHRCKEVLIASAADLFIKWIYLRGNLSYWAMLRSIVRVLNRAEVWSALALALKLSAGVLLLPIAVRKLTSTELGLWYVFVSVANVAWVLEFGLSNTISRSVATLFAGAPKLQPFGMERAGTMQCANIPQLQQLITAVRQVFLVLTLALGVMFLVATLFWPPWGAYDIWQTRAVGFSWLVIALSTLLTCYTRWQPAVLVGLGHVRAAQKAAAIGGGVYLVSMFTMLISGFGVLSFAAAHLLQSLVSRTLVVRCIPANFLEGHMLGKASASIDMLKTIWPMSWRSGCVTLANYLASGGTVVFAAKSLSLAETASYALTLQILMLLQNVAAIPLSVQLPRITVLRATERFAEMRGVVFPRVAVALSIYTFGAVGLLAVGRWLLEVLGSNTMLLPIIPLTISLVTRFLELNHALFAKVSFALNRNEFAIPGVLTAACIPLVAGALAKQWGVIGVCVAVFSIQLVYNNWAPIYYAARELGATFAGIAPQILTESRRFVERKFLS